MAWSSDPARHVVTEALCRGWIVLPGGPAGNVISLSPPLTLSRGLMWSATGMLDEVIGAASA
jgi:4-aminobutyrate aminotransferase-like enzyme